jgi:hypothetical protein
MYQVETNDVVAIGTTYILAAQQRDGWWRPYTDAVSGLMVLFDIPRAFSQ